LNNFQVILLTENEERGLIVTDYLASATLSYGVVFFWLRLSLSIQLTWFMSYVAFYLAGLGPAYLICSKVDRNQFPVAMKSAFFSWGFTMVCLITFTQGDPSSFFMMLLVMFLLGGLTSAVVTMRRRLSPVEG
jgi:hypothetical protein